MKMTCLYESPLEIGSESGMQELLWRNVQLCRRPPDEDRLVERCQELERRCRENRARAELLDRQNKLLEQELHLQSSEILASRGRREEQSLRFAAHLLPKFAGADTVGEAAKWLDSIARASRIFSWSHAETLLAARMSLKGDARRWMTQQRGDLTTWRAFKPAFIERFVRHSGRRSVAVQHDCEEVVPEAEPKSTSSTSSSETANLVLFFSAYVFVFFYLVILLLRFLLVRAFKQTSKFL